jgi:RNA recognition motif-containing protein
MKLFVGNLDKEVTKEDLKAAFTPFGELGEVTVIVDKATSVSKGFGFVEMPKKAEAESAIAGLNGEPLKGKNIVVNEARPKNDSPFRGELDGGRVNGKRRY